MKMISGLFAICISGLFVACAPVLYAPTGQNVPLFHEKGEANFSLGHSSTDDAEGINMMAATAVTSKLAIIGSFYALSESNSDPDLWKGTGRFFELGAGRYGTFGKTQVFAYEIFGGLGYGSIKNNSSDSQIEATFLKPFIQPSIGLGGKVAEIAFTPRIAVVTYTSHRINLTDPTYRQGAEDKKTTFVVEPGLTARVGYKNIKLQFQFSVTGFSYDTNDDYRLVNDDYVSIGLNYCVTKRYRSMQE
ncbi:MAG: hypothetical protein ACOYXT_04655 [Bacteroidota bacterium]